MRDGWRHLGRDESGTSTVEFALVVVPLCMILMGTLDCGRLFWTQNTLKHATEAAARCAQVDSVTCGTSEAIRTFAANSASSIGARKDHFSVSIAPCGIEVTADYEFRSASILPLNTRLQARYCRPN